MADPYVMASTTPGNAPPAPCITPGIPRVLLVKGGKKSITLTWETGSPAPSGGYRIYSLQSGKLQFLAGVSKATLSSQDSGLTSQVS